MDQLKDRTMASRDGSEDEGHRLEFTSMQKQMFAEAVAAALREGKMAVAAAALRAGKFNCYPFGVCLPEARRRVDGGRPLNSSGSREAPGSKIFVLSEQQPLAPLVLVFWLDSGAAHHAVGDARILCNLRNAPAGTAVIAAYGAPQLVHQIGDIQTQYIKIQDVYLVLGLHQNLISVSQLAKDKIVTVFYDNCAVLWHEGKPVGFAVADNVTSLYQLCYLALPTGNPEAGTSTSARGATSRSNFLQLLSLSTSTSTESKMITWDMQQQQQQQCLKQPEFQCRTCGRCFTTFQALGAHRSSHKQQRVHANNLDLLGARSGKGAAVTVQRHDDFTGESKKLSLNLTLALSSRLQPGRQKQQRERDNIGVFQCRTCSRSFATFQALGGHRTQQVLGGKQDLLGARSGKGAAERVHRRDFASEVFPTVQALCGRRAAFHVDDGARRWPFNFGGYRRALAGYSETSLADGKRRHSSSEQAVPGTCPACPICLLYR